MTHLEFDESLKRALLLITESCSHCAAQQLDPRAIRVALKFAVLADSHEALKVLSAQEEEQLDRIARDLLKEAIERNKQELTNKKVSD